MDRSFALFLLGQKGFVSLQYFFSESAQNQKLIRIVFIGRDAGVSDDHADKIEKLCVENHVPYSLDYKKVELAYEAKIGIAIGWRWLIDTKRIKLIVFHDSLLPKYRGFSPLVTALTEGDDNIGVTAIVANDVIDAGDVIKQVVLRIEYPIKVKHAIGLLSEKCGELLVEIVTNLLAGELKTTKQLESEASFSLWRNEEDYAVNWNEPAKKIKRFIDSVGEPYRGASTSYDGTIIRIVDADVRPDMNIVNRKVGKILTLQGNNPIVVCGSGLLEIKEAFIDQSKTPVIFKKLRVRFV